MKEGYGLMKKQTYKEKVADRICQKMKIRLSQRPLLKNIDVVYFKAYYAVVNFEYNGHLYEYRDNMTDADGDFICDRDTGKEIA